MIHDLILQRDNQTPERTFGTITGDFSCETLEPPPNHVMPDRCCIPVGVYTCRLRYSPKHGYAVYGLLNVPGFHDVEIHPGNDVLDSLACILVGATRGTVDVGGQSYDAVLTSRPTFGALMATAGVPNYRDLKDWDAVRAYVVAHPDCETFTLTVIDP